MRVKSKSMLDEPWQIAPQTIRLTDSEIHLWRIQLDQTEEEIETLQQVLTADEREFAGRFRATQARTHFIVRRGRLRQILSRYLGRAPEAAEFSKNTYGKPALHQGSSDSTLCFNTSHSHQWALCACAIKQEIGVDIERLRPVLEFALISQYFSDPEQAVLLQLPEEQQSAAFLAHWTRKEAYLKAIGVGLSMPLNKFSIRRSENDMAIVETHEGAAQHKSYYLHTFTPISGYVATVACQTAPDLMRYWHWD